MSARVVSNSNSLQGVISHLHAIYHIERTDKAICIGCFAPNKTGWLPGSTEGGAGGVALDFFSSCLSEAFDFVVVSVVGFVSCGRGPWIKDKQMINVEYGFNIISVN